MPLSSRQLLGLAFASADLLVELDQNGEITLALGAGEALAGSADHSLKGERLADFVAQDDQELLTMILSRLADGQRAGPVVVRLTARASERPRAVSLTAFRLPDNEGAVSCAMVKAALPAAAGKHGLHDRKSFETAAAALVQHARTSGLQVELALVEAPGLQAAAERAGPPQTDAMLARLAAVLRSQSVAGCAAADLGDDRYALLRQGSEPPEVLAQRITQLLNIDPRLEVNPIVHAVAVSADVPAAQLLKAVRYAIDDFINPEAGPPPASLGDAFEHALARTLSQVSTLGQRIDQGDFALAFQPVVSLQTPLRLHHHEVLIRFKGADGPFAMVRMAEEMDLACALDAAVAERAIERLVRCPTLSLAVNISGRSVSNPAFIAHLHGLIRARPGISRRLILELTESAAVNDLATADAHLQVLRREGCEVCLDDFGAGASSLAYLKSLTVDVVKIDGSFVRELEHDTRGVAFLRQIARLCREMKVATLAEMVETPAVEAIVRDAGIQMAQGWLYGAATAEPSTVVPRPALGASTARRRGSVESWG